MSSRQHRLPSGSPNTMLLRAPHVSSFCWMPRALPTSFTDSMARAAEHPRNRFVVIGVPPVGGLRRVAVAWLPEPVEGELDAEFKPNSLISRLYDLAWASSLPGTFSALCQGLRELILSDLQSGFYPHARPPAAVRPERAQALIGQTLRADALLVAWHPTPREPVLGHLVCST